MDEEIIIETREEQPEVEIFPNPVSNSERLYIQAEDEDGLQEIQIFDIRGKRVKQLDWTQGDGEREIHMDGVAAGTYTVQLLYEDEVSSYKLIVVE